MYYVYILRTAQNTLYTGCTNNLPNRLQEHGKKTGKGAKYLRRFSSFELVYSEELENRSFALRREAEIKKWTKSKKEALIQNSILP